MCLSFASRDSPHYSRNLVAAVYVCVFASSHRARESLNPHHFVGKIDGARLYADVLTRLAAMEESNVKLKEEVEQLQRAQAMARDPRLRYFGVNVSGSNSRSSKSDSVGERAAKAAKAARLLEVKAQVKVVFGPIMSCFFCGTTEGITIAHIVTTGEDEYEEFGTASRYVSDLDVFSMRNFIPLCGHHRQRGSCDDAFDKHLVAIMYDPFVPRYFLVCAEEAPERLIVLSQAPDHRLKLPEGWTPYHRLLAWRAQHSAVSHRYNANLETLQAMNALSEGAESVADNDAEDIEGGLDESDPSQVDLESGPSDTHTTAPETDPHAPDQRHGATDAPPTIK